MKYLPVMLAVLVLASCAKRPDAIVPASIPISAYSNQTCKELRMTLVAEQSNLATLSSAQNSAATGDAVGVFLLGVPTASVFGGDKEGEVAVATGKVNAVQSAMASKNCQASS